MKLKLLYLFAPHIFRLPHIFNVEKELLQNKINNRKYQIFTRLDFQVSPKYSVFEIRDKASTSYIYLLLDIHGNLVVEPFMEAYIAKSKDYYTILTYGDHYGVDKDMKLEDFREMIKFKK